MKPIIRYILLLAVCALLITACRHLSRKQNQPPEAHRKNEVTEALHHMLAQGDSSVKVNGIQLQTASSIHSFYASRGYKPAWVDEPETAREIIALVSNSAWYGLDSTEYNIVEIRKLMAQLEAEEDNNDLQSSLFAQLDLMLTDAYFKFATHINKGRLDPKTLEPRGFSEAGLDLAAHLSTALEKESINESIKALEPKQKDYVYLREAITNYVRNVKIYNDTVLIPDPAEDSVAAYSKVKEILIAQSYMKAAEANNDSAFIGAIKKFQEQHGLNADGKAGANTRAALSVSTFERYRQAVINLERWRWQNDWGNDYVFVNIPAYHLKAYSGKHALELRVIVGKVNSPTPELSSEMDNMITNPFWHVPSSISSKELLPEMRQNPQEYLAKNRYKIYDAKNRMVSPDSIQWDQLTEEGFTYRVRQDAGDGNALGRLKFNFPNKHQVYLHDTPSRNLFSKETRSMSHGCVRVHNPLQLAVFVLKHAGNEQDESDISKMIASGQNSYIQLKKKIPVHIRYFTCEGDSTGRIYFYRDVYNRDKELISKLFNEAGAEPQHIASSEKTFANM